MCGYQMAHNVITADYGHSVITSNVTTQTQFCDQDITKDKG